MTDTDLDRLEAQLEERLQEQSALERATSPPAARRRGLRRRRARARGRRPVAHRRRRDDACSADDAVGDHGGPRRCLDGRTAAQRGTSLALLRRGRTGHDERPRGALRPGRPVVRALHDRARRRRQPRRRRAACRATAQSGEGRMSLTPLEGQPDCGPFVDGEAWSFIRVSPVSVAGAALTQRPNSAAPSPARVVESVNDVAGTWLLQGTGTILARPVAGSSDGAEYLVDDDGDGWAEADQRGTVTLGPDGGVALHPTEGDRAGLRHGLRAACSPPGPRSRRSWPTRAAAGSAAPGAPGSG